MNSRGYFQKFVLGCVMLPEYRCILTVLKAIERGPGGLVPGSAGMEDSMRDQC